MSSAPVLIAGKKTGLSMRKQVTWIQTLAVLVLLAACPAQARTAAIAEPETLLRAQEQLTPWFNLSIAVFSRETRREKNRIYDQINDVETRYLPTVLRNTLIESGHWGAVKVGPVPDISAELQVTGRILESTALVLTLHVEARDSRGVAWINRDYSAPAHTATYEQDRSMRVDPFQPLYNQIANDIYRARNGLQPAEAATVVRAALLRYANALAPAAFGGYLEVDAKGIVEVTRLPAEDDVMYVRVKKIREAEYNFTDAMDEQFSQFFARLQTVYPYWQRYSYELIAYNDRIKATGSASDNQEKPGSWEATEQVYRTFKEFKMNEDEMRELASSFKSEAHATVAELEGSIIELNGPLEEQYGRWREILRALYEQER